MTKVCLIVADDPMARRGLRLIVEALGLDTLEAAGVEQGRRCLSPLPAVVLVVQSTVPTANGGENLLEVLNDLPASAPSRPKIICFEAQGCRGGFEGGSHMVLRKQDISAENVGGALHTLQVL